MSFTGTDYTWGGGTTGSNPNVTVSQANPLVGLSGTETGATYQEIQEVAGDLYIASNAIYTNGNWIQSNAAKASYALRFRSNGSIVERVTAPSGAPTPIVWTTVFSIDTSGNTVVSGTLNVTGATTLAGVNVGGAITGATSITMSGLLSGGTATFTAPLPLGSGGTGATSLAGANIAVTNANNNFSVAQSISGSTGALTLPTTGAQILLGSAGVIYDNGGTIQFANHGLTANNTQFLDTGGVVVQRGNIAVSSGSITSTAGIAAGGAITGATTINASGLITGVGLTAGTGTSQGSSNGSTVSYHPPVYVAAGTAVASTMHCVQDKVTAAGASTSVTLTGAAAFTGATTYVVYVEDTATGAVATVTAQAAGSFTFTSTATHVYSFFCIGT